MDAQQLNERANRGLDHLELRAKGVHAIVLLAHVGKERDVTIGVASNANQQLTAFCAAYLADQLGGRIETPNAAEIADKLHALVLAGAERMATWSERTRAQVQELFGEDWCRQLADLLDLSTDRQTRRATEAVDPNVGVQLVEDLDEPSRGRSVEYDESGDVDQALSRLHPSRIIPGKDGAT